MMQTQYHLLTRKQYRALTGETRQNVANKIKRKTLKTIMNKEEVEVERIVLTPEQFDTIRPPMQVITMDSVHG